MHCLRALIASLFITHKGLESIVHVVKRSAHMGTYCIAWSPEATWRSATGISVTFTPPRLRTKPSRQPWPARARRHPRCDPKSWTRTRIDPADGRHHHSYPKQGTARWTKTGYKQWVRLGRWGRVLWGTPPGGVQSGIEPKRALARGENNRKVQVYKFP